jgi:hypothetical protein
MFQLQSQIPSLITLSRHVVALLKHPLPSGFVVLVLFHPLRIGGTSMFGVEFAEEIVQGL